jgi:hypothetical protein
LIESTFIGVVWISDVVSIGNGFGELVEIGTSMELSGVAAWFCPEVSGVDAELTGWKPLGIEQAAKKKHMEQAKNRSFMSFSTPGMKNAPKQLYNLIVPRR